MKPAGLTNSPVVVATCRAVAKAGDLVSDDKQDILSPASRYTTNVPSAASLWTLLVLIELHSTMFLTDIPSES